MNSLRNSTAVIYDFADEKRRRTPSPLVEFIKAHADMQKTMFDNAVSFQRAAIEMQVSTMNTLSSYFQGMNSAVSGLMMGKSHGGIGVKTTDFFQLMPFSEAMLENPGSVMLGRFLDTDQESDELGLQLSAYHEVRLDIEEPGEKFSLYVGNREGQGVRYYYQINDEAVGLMRASQVRDFGTEVRRMRDLFEDPNNFFAVTHDIMTKINMGQIQKRRWGKTALPERDLGDGAHLSLVEPQAS